MQIKKLIKDNSIIIGSLLTIFFLDRVSKLYVIHIHNINNNSEIFFSKFLNIHLIWNEGVAFGFYLLMRNCFIIFNVCDRNNLFSNYF